MKENPVDISIVIPVYNEESRIETSIKRVIAFLKLKANWRWEIVVSNDGSVDRTEAIVNDLISKTSEGALRLITAPKNMGKGHAVKLGMLAARGQYRLMADADFSMPIKEVDKFVNVLKEGYDVVIGSRAIRREKGCDVQQSFFRRLAGRIFNLLVRLIVLRGFQDTQCGFKCYTRRAAEDLFANQQCGGFAFDVEILCLAQKKGYAIKEIPVMWKECGSSKVRFFRDSIKMVKDLFYLKTVLSKQ